MTFHLQKNNLHHAYFVVGDRTALKSELLAFIESDLKIKTSGNPDYQYLEFETLGVDDARSIKEQQEKKGFGEDKRIFIIAFNFITGEAQNALLKMFEEPSPNTHFFILAPTAAILLPTLKSRIIILDPGSSGTSDEARKFLKASIDERLKMAEKFKDADNETKKSELLTLIGNIEIELSKEKTKDVHVFEELYELKRAVLQRSPSVKMISEYLALRLPSVLK